MPERQFVTRNAARELPDEEIIEGLRQHLKRGREQGTGAIIGFAIIVNGREGGTTGAVGFWSHDDFKKGVANLSDTLNAD